MVPPSAMESGGSSAMASRMRVVTSDRKSTRLNSSHLVISYAVFCFGKIGVVRRKLVGEYTAVEIVLPSTFGASVQIAAGASFGGVTLYGSFFLNYQPRGCPTPSPFAAVV